MRAAPLPVARATGSMKLEVSPSPSPRTSETDPTITTTTTTMRPAVPNWGPREPPFEHEARPVAGGESGTPFNFPIWPALSARVSGESGIGSLSGNRDPEGGGPREPGDVLI